MRAARRFGGATTALRYGAVRWGDSLRRGDRPEEAVGLVVRTRGEIERVRGSGTGAVPEADSPETVDRDRPVVDALHDAVRLPAILGRPAEGVDPAVAEVSDEE